MRQRGNRVPSPNLARLFSIGKGSYLGWDEPELAKILRAQLRAPLLSSLKPKASEIHDLVAEARSSDSPLPETVGELLVHPNPPLSLLRLAKDFAKSSDSGSDPVPPAVATALYTSVIAAALARHGKRISALDDLK